jgi:Winged helix DNA-binding domain
MRLTARRLNRATLQRQLLLERSGVGVVDAVRAVAALQAQSPAGPYIGLWNRIAAFDGADLDRAYAEHQVVRSSLMRMTVQMVTRADYPAFHLAMVPDLRRGRLADPRFTVGGVSIKRADALMKEVIAFTAEARTKGELETMIAQRTRAGAGKPVWWAYRYLTPIVQAPTGGPWSFGERASYLAARVKPFEGERAAALAVLIRRYLEAFGPAAATDIGMFSMLPQPPIKAGLAILEDELTSYEGPDGKQLLDVHNGPLPPEDAPAPPRLLPMWDNVVLAHRDRSRIVPEAYRRVIGKNNGDTLPSLLVDGYVAGVWRPAQDEAGGIEITAFHRLDAETWRGLEREAQSLASFLADRDPHVYSRYNHWWKSLSGDEVRVLGR